MRFSGSALRRARIRLGLTPLELARRAMVDPFTILRLEANMSRKPHRATLAAVARALRIKVDTLFNGGRR